MMESNTMKMSSDSIDCIFSKIYLTFSEETCPSRSFWQNLSYHKSCNKDVKMDLKFKFYEDIQIYP